MLVNRAFLLPLFFFLFFPQNSFAGYRVAGKITGSECTNYVLFEKCTTRNIDAVKGDDGSLYALATYYNNVSSYRGGRCWINVKSSSFGGVVAGAINAFMPEFYEMQDDGTYERVDVDHITFKCFKD